MKISIIIPVYNVEKYIKRCLLSCLEEQDMTQNEYEVIVVDDNSTDSDEYIQRYHRALPPSPAAAPGAPSRAGAGRFFFPLTV